MGHSIVLITGATSGIGQACARRFAEGGYNLIVTGRRQDRLQSLQADLQASFAVEVHPLVFDVRDRVACKAAIASLPPAWQHIGLLINNAGLAAGMAPIDEGDAADWDRMIDTNVKGLLYVTQTVLPLLKAGKGTQIINIGSTAAKDVYPNGNVYNATKFAVDALSRAMRIDLLSQGIKVTAIHPGAVETEFSVVRFKGDQQKADQVYEGYTPLRPEDVAETAFFCATRPAHVCINDLVLTCTDQANGLFIHRSES